MADREPDHPNGESGQQLRYYQMRGETWLLKLKLIILAVLCVLLGAFLVVFKVQAHIQDIHGSMHDSQSDDDPTLNRLSESVKMLQAVKGNLTQEAQWLKNNLTEKEMIYRDIIQKKENSIKEKDTRVKELEAEKDQLTKDLQAVCERVKDVCCAEGWKYFSGRCYYFSTNEKTWTESRAACVAAGGDLVVISSTEEQDFLKRSYGGYVEQRYWVGLTDAVKEGDWRWLDGTRLSETPIYWIEREPDNWKGEMNQYPEGENCAEMRLHTSSYYLRDSFCDVEGKKEKRICEAKAPK